MEGKGEPLLFIPGTASDLRQEKQIFASPLLDRFQILSFDPRGIGQSNSPDASPTMLDYAHDVKLLLDQVGWKDAIVVGESFGGMIAQEFAIHYQPYLSKLVLVVTSSGGKGGSSFPYHQYDVSKMSSEEKADFWVQCGDLRYVDPKWKESSLYKDQYFNYLEIFHLAESNPERQIFAARQIGARKGHDTYERLPQIKVPTYICAGRYDKTAPIENQLALLQQIPHARLTFFEGSHMVLWQDPFAFESIASFCKTGCPILIG